MIGCEKAPYQKSCAF